MNEKIKIFKYKQALVLRKDIKMSPGKAVAQGSHVSVLSAIETRLSFPEIYDEWTKEGHAKIVLRVDSLDELEDVKQEAIKNGMIVHHVKDFGLTEIPAGTMTAIAIGPDNVEKIDAITRKLKLY